MALDYQATNALMNDGTFRGRVKVACLHFAVYIADEAPDVPAHVTRVKWAQQTMQQADTSAAQVMPVVVMDPNVQSQGSDIDDPALQSAVETAVGKMI